MEELEAMSLASFKHYVARLWAIGRHDLRGGHGDDTDSVGIERALETLKVSRRSLVNLMRNGILPRPGFSSSGAVVWRKDELESALSRLGR